MIETIERSGPARIVNWSSDNLSCELPEVLFYESKEVAVPEYFHLIIKLEEGRRKIIDNKSGTILELPPLGKIQPPLSWLMNQFNFFMEMNEDAVSIRAPPESFRNLCGKIEECDQEIVILDGAFELRRNPRQLIRSLSLLKEMAGPNKLIYLPAIMEPSNLALLVYLGADLFDTSFVTYMSRMEMICLPEGNIHASKAKSFIGERNFKSILEFNLKSIWRELQLVKLMIMEGRMREFVEFRAAANASTMSALRILDHEYYEYQEKYMPISGSKLSCITKESLFRPDVVRYRRRLTQRYEKPSTKKFLLLLPCSARKPYSRSKTHRILESVITSVENWRAIHQVIVTSPLGLVPRELELFYPAAHYDVPVTGRWDLDERSIVIELLDSLSLGKYEVIICHLDRNMDFITKHVDCISTSNGEPLSHESLSNLRKELQNLCSSVSHITKEEDEMAEMESIARFQFGKGAEILLQGCRVFGKYPYLKILEGDEQVAMLTPERGMYSLTLHGARKIMALRTNWVEIEEFQLRGNLFAAGVRDADKTLRIGDEAIVVRGEDVIAVGTASMSGEEMIRSKRGEAVRVRHIAQERDD
ncbi:MAG: archaeosine synthase subunit alpha [Methanomassiliicoccales archaeon]